VRADDGGACFPRRPPIRRVGLRRTGCAAVGLSIPSPRRSCRRRPSAVLLTAIHRRWRTHALLAASATLAAAHALRLATALAGTRVGGADRKA